MSCEINKDTLTDLKQLLEQKYVWALWGPFPCLPASLDEGFTKSARMLQNQRAV